MSFDFEELPRLRLLGLDDDTERQTEYFITLYRETNDACFNLSIFSSLKTLVSLLTPSSVLLI